MGSTRRRVACIGHAAALLAVAWGGSASGGSKTFDEKGFAITFKYPSSFETATSITFAKRAGGAAVDRKGMGLDAYNLIIVSRFQLRVSVTSANVAQVRNESDRLFSQVFGKRLHGRRIVIGGLPGYEYRGALSKPPQGRSRIEVLFDRKVEYTVSCQSTPKRRAELDRGCQQALRTLHRK